MNNVIANYEYMRLRRELPLPPRDREENERRVLEYQTYLRTVFKI